MEARCELYEREEAYRFYVSDAAKALTENVANIFGGKYMDERYQEKVNKSISAETRTAEEVIADIRRKLSEGR